MKVPNKTVHTLKWQHVIAPVGIPGLMLDVAARKLRTGDKLGCYHRATFLVKVGDHLKVFFTITHISPKLKLHLRIWHSSFFFNLLRWHFLCKSTNKFPAQLTFHIQHFKLMTKHMGQHCSACGLPVPELMAGLPERWAQGAQTWGCLWTHLPGWPSAFNLKLACRVRIYFDFISSEFCSLPQIDIVYVLFNVYPSISLGKY